MILVKNLSKRFGATVALADVSAQFHEGEVHCVLGENGAGKSTLGKIIGGLYRPDDGHIEIDGLVQVISSPKVAHELGVAVCYQELSLARHLSVRANLWLGAESTGHPFARINNREERGLAEQVLEKLGLDVDLEQPVGELPVAQQQLIEIGKALMQKPRIVIFDEPTAMLGAVEKRKFLDVLKKLREEGVTVLLITHHIEDVMAVSDRVTIMRNGRAVDSFPMRSGITAEEVVERLTGKKRERLEESTTERSEQGAQVLQIDNLRWRSGGLKPIRVSRGQIVSLYGVVGCGAEQIVAALVGQPTSRKVTFRLGEANYRPTSAAQALSQGVAYLPSGRAANCVFPALSIAENLTLGNLSAYSRFGVILRSKEAKAAETTLRDSGVKFNDASLSITSLSGGNQQKVLIARVMSAARTVVVLEEPTAGVDIDAKAQIHARIREAAEGGITVVLMSSDLEESIALSNVLYTLYRSEVVNAYVGPTASDQPDIIADVLGQRAAETRETHEGAHP